MGKASRRARKNQSGQSGQSGAPKVLRAPFVARPFEGLPGEPDWVAMREIVPAATATVRLRDDAPALRAALADSADSTDSTEGSPDLAVPQELTITTVLPMTWPGLHRADGTRFVALQSVPTRGDASRDLVQVVLALLATPAGQPVGTVSPATFDTPRLQDILDVDAPFEVTVHEGFDYWIAPDVDLDAEGQASLRQANESAIPTTKLASAPAAYWCRVGERTHLRWALPDDEDDATAALARLHASGALAGPNGLGESTRFLGAFRADGLLVPVWDLDPALEADAYEVGLAALAERYAAALAATDPLTAQERRARAGLLSRQLTLR